MTADQIRESPLGEGETRLMREIAAQLADLNESIVVGLRVATHEMRRP